jgi:hypothetical protein
MFLDRDSAKQLSVLRGELLAWNRIDQFQRRGEAPPDSLKADLKHPSLKVLLEDISSVIGREDRVDARATIPTVRASVESVALICSALDLTGPTLQDPNWRLNGIDFLCPGQNFSGEPGLPSRGFTPATGFLVGVSGRYVLTARHVAANNYGNLNPQLYCVFGYQTGTVGGVLSFQPSNVVAVRSLVTLGVGDDWALVELESSTGRAGLPLRASGTPAVSDPVIAIGHPYGMPVKTGPGAIRDVSAAQYRADLDISPGTSGAPVIAVDANGNPSLVEGIVATTLRDLTYVEEPKCSIWSKSCSQDDKDCWAGFVPIAKVLASSLFVKTVFP